ncbi:hypothetical protein QLL95_gp0811 [Cotonvirus japonicus]|uniref:Uncharacterized protein n=1 Tax=Cotonvirus japonicus TaxID=2811091 RepID=A0ABM7NT24_9VIRU|nr:hypothetical protein QLL95_gp0811 [Cotonvirus japonicus]BCS83312.1 hypothetical protein [Cotonvirus japonicus]
MTDVPVTKTTDIITERIKPGTFTSERGHFARYFNVSGWQMIVIAGIAISSIAAFATTYDAITGLDKKIESCEQTTEIKKQLNTKFIVILVLSCLAVVLGLLLAWFFRTQANQRRLLTLGITGGGLIGILYSLSLRFRNATNLVKLGISWVSLLAFVLLGFFISSGKTDTVV